MKYRICWRNLATGLKGYSLRAWKHAEALELCKAKNQSTKFEYWIEDLPYLEIKGWIHEDELPPNYPYDQMYPESRVIAGVRMFPDVTL
jgi:hypothetical protein